MSAAVMEAKGTSSTESTSIFTGPTGYWPPSLTLGRRHSRKDTVISPDITSSRSCRLNSINRMLRLPPGLKAAVGQASSRAGLPSRVATAPCYPSSVDAGWLPSRPASTSWCQGLWWIARSLHGRLVARYSLPGIFVFHAGITESGGTGFFVGSMGDGTIYRGDTASGDVEMFLLPDDDGRATITGLDLDGYGRLIACDYDGGQLFVYDLAARELVARRALPAEESWPNDVVVAGDSAYVTDTRYPRVWRLPVGRGDVGDAGLAIDLAPFGPADPAYLNGIVAHPDASALLVASQDRKSTRLNSSHVEISYAV